MDNYFEDMVRSAAQASAPEEKTDIELYISNFDQSLKFLVKSFNKLTDELTEIRRQNASIVEALKVLNDANAMKSYPVVVSSPPYSPYTLYPSTGHPPMGYSPYYTTCIATTAGNTQPAPIGLNKKEDQVNESKKTVGL